MNRRQRRRLTTLIGSATLAALITSTDAQAITVFDPLNYEQNLLTAARALENIQNQVRQLQNQAQQLLRMDRNLQPLNGSIGPDLQSALGQLRARITEGDALALKVRDTDSAYASLYPTTFSDTLAGDTSVRAAKSRWDETHASFKRAALVQGQITESNESDGRLLDQILSRSQGAVGNLQVAQAGNELTALNVKQSLQLQSLLTAQSRAETTDRARSLVAQEEARQRFKSFLGDGRAYTASR